MKIADGIFYVGVNDRKIDLFEGQYVVPEGMAYNSYVIIDDAVAVMDTVDAKFTHEWLDNVQKVLGRRKPDYLVVQHMEPDHSANINNFAKLYPEVKIVASKKAFTMMKNFFGTEFEDRRIIVGDGDALPLGKRTLKFVTAPMVHWPEVMITYDKTDKILFSADAFGTFGAINGNLFDSEVDWERDYLAEARRYYTNIVGKYGLQVQMMLKKAAALDIKMICPLHGLMIRENINLLLDKYNKWSLYLPEENGVMIAYSSVYGGTESAVSLLASKLADSGVRNIKMFDVSMTHPSFVLSEAFRFSHIVLATTTYNAGIFESMETFLHILISHNLQNRKYVVIQNGSWAPACGGQMREILEKLKGTEILDDSICIKSTLKEEQIEQMDNVVDTIVKSLKI